MTPEKERIYQELFEANTNRLYQYIYRKTGDDSDTEDIVQDVFIAFLFHFDEFIPEYPNNSKQVMAWLFRVAGNKVLHYWRKNQKILDTEISTELLPELIDQQAAFGETDLSLPDWLSPEDKRLIFLKYSGYSLREIAPRLGITYGACRMRSARLAEKLKKYFDK